MKYPPAPKTRKKSLWIMSVPVITTAHFTQDDADRIYANAVVASKDGQMAILFIDEDDDYKDFGLSTKGIAVLKKFRKLGYHYLRLDADGEKVEGLKTYEW